MKATGTRYERETVIHFNEEDKSATLFTFSDVVYRRMLKRGWSPTTDEERHATFEFPKGAFRLPLNRKRKGNTDNLKRRTEDT